jgi:hypothetical protein
MVRHGELGAAGRSMMPVDSFHRAAKLPNRFRFLHIYVNTRLQML